MRLEPPGLSESCPSPWSVPDERGDERERERERRRDEKGGGADETLPWLCTRRPTAPSTLDTARRVLLLVANPVYKGDGLHFHRILRRSFSLLYASIVMTPDDVAGSSPCSRRGNASMDGKCLASMQHNLLMRDIPDGLDDCFAMQGFGPVLGYEEQSAALTSRAPTHRLNCAPIDEDSCMIHAEILKRPLRSPLIRFAGGDGPWLAVPVSQLFCCGADSQISGHAKGERTTLSRTGLSSVM